MLESHGFGAAGEAIRAAFAAGDWDAMVAAVTPEMVDRMALAGTPDEVKAAARRYEGILDHLILYAPSYGISAERAVENANRLVETFGGTAMSARRRHLIALESFGGPEVMRWVEADAPDPGPEEVAVEVEALGVNFGDTMVRRGEYRRDQPLDFTPGFEAAGRVVEDPSGELEAGQRVIVFNDNGRGYADLLVVPRHRVFPVPDDVDPTVLAAIFIQGTTAWYSLFRFGYLAAGEWALIHAGAGRRRRPGDPARASPPGRGRSPPPRPRRSSRSPAATAPSTRSSPTPRPSPPRSAS